jgi:hypothetical protein
LGQIKKLAPDALVTVVATDHDRVAAVISLLRTPLLVLGSYLEFSVHQGIKTERKQTELTNATFVFIFLFYERKNEYKTPETNLKADTVGHRYESITMHA